MLRSFVRSYFSTLVPQYFSTLVRSLVRSFRLVRLACCYCCIFGCCCLDANAIAIAVADADDDDDVGV